MKLGAELPVEQGVDERVDGRRHAGEHHRGRLQLAEQPVLKQQHGTHGQLRTTEL